MGRPSLPPGVHFRLLLIGHFEGIDSERGIAWRAADSLALRDFLGLGLTDAPLTIRRFPGPDDLLHSKRIGRCSPGCCKALAAPA
jgi:transposase